MPDFLDKLSQAVEANRNELTRHLRREAAPAERDLEHFVRDHWSPLPGIDVASGAAALGSGSAAGRPAFAIDGSMRQMDLDNGSYFVIAQALAIGDGGEQASVDVQILPPATARPTAARFADLVQRHRELYLAHEMVKHHIPEGGVLYLDGALYGLLPQLYPSQIEDSAALEEYPALILDVYLGMLEEARKRNIDIIAVSKTSREATHLKLWMNDQGGEIDLGEAAQDLSDSSMIHRWTDGAPGVSEPVVLGSWGFTGGSTAMLDRPEVRASTAIVSFFVRLEAFDDALRIDVPAHQVGSSETLGSIDGGLLEGGVAALTPMIEVLATDYGGPEVYNALLYSVDREVRLKRDIVAQVYLPMISELIGHPVRADRSSRRFL